MKRKTFLDAASFILAVIACVFAAVCIVLKTEVHWVDVQDKQTSKRILIPDCDQGFPSKPDYKIIPYSCERTSK